MKFTTAEEYMRDDLDPVLESLKNAKNIRLELNRTEVSPALYNVRAREIDDIDLAIEQHRKMKSK